MCTIIFAYKAHKDYDFIYLGNRDEYKNRPSSPAHFWRYDSHILGGMDLKEGGTWSAITKDGRLGFITNYRDLTMIKEDVLSRGFLPRDFVTSTHEPKAYLEGIKCNHSQYNPFNLIVGSMDGLYYYSNVENKIKPVKPGIHGLSNALLNTPWYKVEKAKSSLNTLLNREDFSVEELFKILDDEEIPPDELLPNTGIRRNMERLLSPIHVDIGSYGTTFKTLILVDKIGHVHYYEKSLSDKGYWNLNTFEFDLEKLPLIEDPKTELNN